MKTKSPDQDRLGLPLMPRAKALQQSRMNRPNGRLRGYPVIYADPPWHNAFESRREEAEAELIDMGEALEKLTAEATGGKDGW